jgi:hypothetical protein
MCPRKYPPIWTVPLTGDNDGDTAHIWAICAIHEARDSLRKLAIQAPG